MTEESIRLTVAEMWTEELLALVERMARSTSARSSEARALLAKIDALEVPDRPQRKRSAPPLEEGSFW